MSYLVVLENILNNGKPGGRFFTEYSSKEEFENRSGRDLHKVIATDVSVDKAVRLCEGTPARQIIDELIQNATINGKLNEGILGMEFATWLTPLIETEPLKLALRILEVKVVMIGKDYPDEVYSCFKFALKRISS